MQVVDGFAVGVVVQVTSQLRERGNRFRCESIRLSERLAELRQLIAEGRDDGPTDMSSTQVAVDDRAGAHIGRGVDMGVEARMSRQIARKMMVEIPDLRAGPQQTVDVLTVLFVRDVEDGDLIAATGFDTPQQLDVALDAGDQHGLRRLGEPQLLQRAESVRVAVEGEEVSRCGGCARIIRARSAAALMLIRDEMLGHSVSPNGLSQGMKSPPLASSVAPVMTFA